jgi:uroporphyrinogen decarboxylase
MIAAEKQGGFAGLRVVAFESRRNRETAELIARQGGKALVAPSLREVPLQENKEAFAFGEELFAGRLDMIICTTGVGLRTLVEALSTRHPLPQIQEALRRVTLVCRGPKPVSVLGELGLLPHVTVPEPNTWREVLAALDAKAPVKGLRVAVQEYGVPNLEFLNGLEERGAVLLRVPVYRWSLPEDIGPLQGAVREVAAGRADALLFTTATQVNNVLQVARELGLEDSFRAALRRAAVFSIGPTCSERMKEMGVPVDMEPSHPKLGALVVEAARRCRGILEGKRREPEISVAAPRPGAPAGDPLSESLFLRACRREPVERTPVWLMRQAGRYMKDYRDLRAKVPMLELCKHPDLSAEVTVDAAKRLDVDAAIIFSDLLLIVEPLGFELEYAKGEGPRIRPAIRTAADVDRLREPAVKESMAYVLEAIRKTRAALPPHIPLLGFAAAPFTLASYLIEGEGSRTYVRTKSFMYAEPRAWERLMSRLAGALADLLNAQADAGAQAVQVFDSWVGCLSPADYRRFVLPHSRALFQKLKPDLPVIHFGTQTGDLLELMKEAGGTVLGLDWRVELDKAWARAGDVAVMGNLDPATLFSSPKEIRGQAKRILDQAGGRPGHIFNLGHGILPETPVENVLALVDAVKELSRRG